MSEHFISVDEAREDLLACATYIAERITSGDGRAEAISAVVPHYLAKGDVDLAAELANTVDDPFTRDRLLTYVAEKCAELDDDEYALQLADAVEDPAMREQAFERIGLQKAANGEFEKAREIASGMAHPDSVYGGIAFKQAEAGDQNAAGETLELIEFPGASVAALEEIAASKLRAGMTDAAADYLEQAAVCAEEIEHEEERIRSLIGVGHLFIEAGKNGRAVEIFDKAQQHAAALDNVYRDGFLGAVALGFLHAGSLELADRALDLVADKTEIATALLGYSQEFWKKDERGDALESLEEAYAILKSQLDSETRNSKAKFRLFSNIAAQFAGFGKSERAIEIAQTIEDEAEQTSALTQIAAVLSQRNEAEQARHALRAIPDDGNRVFALIGMSDANEKNGDRTAAVEMLDEAAALVESVPQLSLRSSAYGAISKRFIEFGETAKAEQALSNNLASISSIRDDSVRSTALASVAQSVEETRLSLSDGDRELMGSFLIQR